LVSTAVKILWVPALIALLLIAPPVGVYAQKGPIKIGIDTELTGVVSETSTNAKMGYDLYLQEMGHKVAGRDIKIIEYDNKTDYKVAFEVAQKLVEKDQVHILCLGSSTGAAVAIRGYTEKAKVPFAVIGMAGGEQVTLLLKYTFAYLR
jgi:branched-chain amino acid transport system substrate-binding protein